MVICAAGLPGVPGERSRSPPWFTNDGILMARQVHEWLARAVIAARRDVPLAAGFAAQAGKAAMTWWSTACGDTRPRCSLTSIVHNDAQPPVGADPPAPGRRLGTGTGTAGRCGSRSTGVPRRSPAVNRRKPSVRGRRTRNPVVPGYPRFREPPRSFRAAPAHSSGTGEHYRLDGTLTRAQAFLQQFGYW